MHDPARRGWRSRSALIVWRHAPNLRTNLVERAHFVDALLLEQPDRGFREGIGHSQATGTITHHAAGKVTVVTGSVTDAGI